jgi:hypothetical protein
MCSSYYSREYSEDAGSTGHVFITLRSCEGGIVALGRLVQLRITCYKPYNIIQLTLYVTQREHALTSA